MDYNPPDDNACDIVDTLRYEARWTETAIAVRDESTEDYGLMCRSAADEIERLRALIAEPRRVVIHFHDPDDPTAYTVYADPGVTVYGISEAAPNDRTYRYTHDPIPADLLDESAAGHADDDQPIN